MPTHCIFRVLAADNRRGEYTEVLAEQDPNRRLQLVRDLRAEAVEAAAAEMDTSAAAASGADRGPSAAPDPGAEEADREEEESSESDLPDTRAPEPPLPPPAEAPEEVEAVAPPERTGMSRGSGGGPEKLSLRRACWVL